MVALREDDEYNNTDEINAFIAVKNLFRYRSYYYDFETNLYYLNSRYYDPEIGRFINADNISNVDKSTFNGLNLYAYCVNNPVMLTDSQGESWWSDFWKGVKNFFKKVGDVIAGTGTMELDGKVGEISGVKYKLIGAVKKGADVFIVPTNNYEEALSVKQENNYDIEIIEASTFKEAVEKLKNR